MKRIIFLLNLTAVIMLSAAAPAFSKDIYRLAPGAQAQLSTLLNKTAMVSPVAASPLGKGWFSLETDAHVFVEGSLVRQFGEVITDIDNQAKYFDGKRSKLTAKLVSRTPDEVIVDFVSIAIIPIIRVQLKTPYRASVKIPFNTDTHFAMEITQLQSDSSKNDKIKNLDGARYAEEVIIDGKKYTYIRMYSKMEIDALILTKNQLENNAGPTNVEAMEMMIKAAKSLDSDNQP